MSLNQCVKGFSNGIHCFFQMFANFCIFMGFWLWGGTKKLLSMEKETFIYTTPVNQCATMPVMTQASVAAVSARKLFSSYSPSHTYSRFTV